MADSDKQVSYGLKADASPFEAGLQRGSDAARGFANNIDNQFKKVSDAFASVQKQLVVLAGLVAGGAFFKDAINASNQLAGETVKLQKALGLTGEEAGTLRTALEDIGSSGDEYVDAFSKFARQLKSNEDGLQRLGLRTRDANGNLRDSKELFTEALGSVGTYKAGLDQTTYAQTLFGKSIDEVRTLQKLNNGVMEEAARKNRELGLVVTQENVEASKKYKLAMNDVSDVLTAVKKVIGDAVMPVFTELGEYFASTGPYVVAVFKGAMLSLLAAFEVVKAAVKTVAGIVFEAFNLIVDGAGLIGEVFSKLFKGDFSGAYEAAKKVGQRTAQAFNGAFENFLEAGNDAEAAVKRHTERMFGDKTPAAAPKGGSKRMGEFRDSKDTSRVSGWDAQLAEQKLALQEKSNTEGTFYTMSKQQELAFWKEKLHLTQDGSAENIAVRKKAAELQLGINQDAFQHEVAALQTQETAYRQNMDAKLALLDREAELVKQRYGAESKEYEEVQKKIVEAKRQAVEQIKQIDIIRAQSARDAQLSQLALEEQHARLQAELGEITQQQLLAKEQEFEQRRFEIALQGLKEREQILAADPDRNVAALAQIHAAIEEAERQHQERLAEIKGQAAREQSKYVTGAFNEMNSGFASVLSKTLQGTQTLAQTFRGLFQAVTTAVANMLAKIAADWIMEQIRTMIFGKVAAASTVTGKAAEAGAAGVASMAGAPWPLNMTAPAFGAAMFANALAYGGALASAAGGYDIPGTIDPIVQAHASEMILPAKYADVIRGMADNGSAGQQAPAPAVQVTLKAAPMPGDFFMVHRAELVKVLKAAGRDFVGR